MHLGLVSLVSAVTNNRFPINSGPVLLKPPLLPRPFSVAFKADFLFHSSSSVQMETQEVIGQSASRVRIIVCAGELHDHLAKHFTGQLLWQEFFMSCLLVGRSAASLVVTGQAAAPPSRPPNPLNRP